MSFKSPFALPNTLGIAFNLAAVFTFSLMDLLAKHLIGQEYHPLQVTWARYSGQTVLILVLILPRARMAFRTRRPGLQLLRSILQFSTNALFFLSLGYIGLAEATAIADLSPMLIALGAAAFFGEKLGPRRIMAILLAMIGAMLIIRPGTDVFHPASLLALGCAVAFAGFVLITRRMGGADSMWTSLLYSGLLGTLMVSTVQWFVWKPIQTADLWGFILIGGLGTISQLCIIRAYSFADASVIAPIGYFGIVFASVWGVVILGESLPFLTIVGALVIIGSGLYVWHRERRIEKMAQGSNGQ
ncbi:MAG: DMT family transporter [Paracoccaceae bacterium]